jgi:hypothetical protein
MTCPHCGESLPNPYAPTCPHCGQALTAGPWTNPSGAAAPPNPSAPLYTPGQTAPGGMGGYGAAGSPSQWGPPSYGGPWPAQEHGPPAYGPPAYGPPGYGQYAPPSYPMAYGPPSTGTPPAYGPPTSPYPYAPVPPPRRSRTGLIIGVVVGVVVVLATCVGAGVYFVGQSANLSNTIGAGTPTAFAATPTTAATIVFQDPLTSNTNGWAVDPPHCQFADGGYQITDDYLCFAPAGVIRDGTITVQARQTQGISTQGFGIMLRRPSHGNYYIFGIDSNSKWVFFRVVNDNLTRVVDFTENAAIKGGLNSVNVLSVHAAGSHFDFYVNGTKVGQADDSTFASGRVGLAGGTNIQVVYNNFKVTNP